jgi:RNA polymerase sigma-70 factor (ECF subfamily)
MGRADGKHERRLATPEDGAVPLDFAGEFQASFRVLWMIAVGIVQDPATAEDVVQEAAVLALEKLDQFKPGTNFRAWMAQMVRFVALNQARKRKRLRTSSLETEAETLPHPASYGDLRLGNRGELPTDQPYFDDQVIRALNSVSEVARACLLLRTLEHLEYSEIARLLDIPEGTAMSHVHRTRQQLREQLADHAPMLAARRQS